ncbi:MAG: hypothetical protein RJA81_1638 [Planctomycetota bacterium]|jgi:transcriptional regulator with XRE-family HTH domain
MGYIDNLQKLCLLRGLDQNTLAKRVGISKSSMSRILNGSQEPKLILASKLARELDVTLDLLMSETDNLVLDETPVKLTKAQQTILELVERMGYDTALNRLLAVHDSAISSANRTKDSESVEKTTENQGIPSNRPHALNARRSN